MKVVAPFLTVASFWLLLGAIWYLLSGWKKLARRYPNRPEAPLASFRNIGYVNGVGAGAWLYVAACDQGIRIAIWRLFCPWARPFFVPWPDTRANLRKPRPIAELFEKIDLTFGDPPAGKISVLASEWRRVAEIVPQAKALIEG